MTRTAVILLTFWISLLAGISAAGWTAVTVSDGGSPVAGNVLTAPASVTPAYDNDGNLLSDGVWTYTWDAENRLVKAVRNLAGIPYREIRHDYDAHHRLIRKRVFHTSGGSAVLTEKYLHESGRRLLTVNASNQAVQSFHWGLDVSGTPDGAAGAGGLLWIHDHASGVRHLVCTDGNANVTHLVDAATGEVTAAYEYSPHGELLRATGSYAFTNPFRFSTKAQDDLTGLLDYGRRFHKPDWGVWLSRDPAGDIDGLNLYGFCQNDPINHIDVGGYATFGQEMWGVFLAGLQTATDPVGHLSETGSNYASTGRGVYNGAKGAVEGVASIPELAAFVASGEALDMLERLRNDPAYREALTKELGKEFCQWLQHIQTNDGAFEAYGETAFGILSGAGAMKVINAAKKLKGMRFAKKVPGPRSVATPLTGAQKELYGRVSHRKGLRESVWERSKSPDGKVYDPSGVEIKPGEPWDMGHTPGNEFAQRQRWAAEQEMSRKEWIDYQNDPDIYQPELPRSNQGHNFEDPWYDVR